MMAGAAESSCLWTVESIYWECPVCDFLKFQRPPLVTCFLKQLHTSLVSINRANSWSQAFRCLRHIGEYLTQTTIVQRARSFLGFWGLLGGGNVYGCFPWVYVCILCVFLVPTEARGGCWMYPLELELKTVVNCHMTAGNWTCVLWQTGQHS